MARYRALTYLSTLVLGFTAVLAFTYQGILSYAPLMYGFVIIPVLELLLKPNERNLSEAEEELAKHDPIYDWMIYLMVPIHVAILVVFLLVIGDPSLLWWEILGLVLGMGLLCGTYGINIGHELGHRTKKYEQMLAKIALLTSLYMHFFIEHNRGHHKRVSTPEDPASSRYGESLYAFWIRSVWGSYLSAWGLEARRLTKIGQPIVSLHNEMIRFQLIQLAVVLAIGWGIGWVSATYFVLAAIVGFLTLETVNYIEHYGLERKELAIGHFERVQPHHSWNSNHVLGRLMLFELSRHSDHHYLASRKYQILQHHEGAPQMPTGYPGMMVLATVPPLWFRVMHRELDRISGLTGLVEGE